MRHVVPLLMLLFPTVMQAQAPAYGAADLERDVRARHAAFRACKRDRERVGEQPAGTVRVGVTLRPDGSMFPAVVEADTTGNTLFTGCILSVFRDVRTAARPASPLRFTFVVTVDASDLRLGEFLPASSARAQERTIEANVNVGAPTQAQVPSGGTFDSSVVRAALWRASAAIRRCYENQLRTQPDLAGKIVVAFRIETSGTVSNARHTENTTGSDALATCIVAAVMRMRFDPGPVGGAVDYRYPFVFSPYPDGPQQAPESPLPEIRVDAALLHTPAFARCEQEARGLDPALEATVFVTVAVEPSGRIGEARASANHERHRALALCLERAVRTLSFQRSEAGTVTRFRYRFDFARVAR